MLLGSSFSRKRSSSSSESSPRRSPWGAGPRAPLMDSSRPGEVCRAARVPYCCKSVGIDGRYGAGPTLEKRGRSRYRWWEREAPGSSARPLLFDHQTSWRRVAAHVFGGQVEGCPRPCMWRRLGVVPMCLISSACRVSRFGGLSGWHKPSPRRRAGQRQASLRRCGCRVDRKGAHLGPAGGNGSFHQFCVHSAFRLLHIEDGLVVRAGRTRALSCGSPIRSDRRRQTIKAGKALHGWLGLLGTRTGAT